MDKWRELVCVTKNAVIFCHVHCSGQAGGLAPLLAALGRPCGPLHGTGRHDPYTEGLICMDVVYCRQPAVNAVCNGTIDDSTLSALPSTVPVVSMLATAAQGNYARCQADWYQQPCSAICGVVAR